MRSSPILVVDDEESIRKILTAMLEAERYDVIAVSNLACAKQCLKDRPIEVVLTDLKLERENGLDLLKWMRDEQHPAPVIVLTAHATVDSAVDAMKQGAFDYLSKPFDRSDLMRLIKKAVLTYQFQSQYFLKTINSSHLSFPSIGSNEKMLKIFTLIERVANTDATVLITGESGTGKELVAQAIHERSARRTGPIIKINCAAIPQNLMESELFGYERGAFTGAVTSKPGRFELADKGTLFLDEIGEMSTEMQVKLLRALQDRSFERVGGLRTINVDVRLIAATNKQLEVEVKEGRFRSDLYYRLNVVPIVLPPLRDRPDDIPRLVAHFINKFSERLKRTPATITPEALELLTQFPWPGNIRQLENAVERLIVVNESVVITPENLPEEILDYEEERFLASMDSANSLKDRVKDATRRIERKAIEEALAETSHNVTHAARKLNISRKGLQLKMKELGLR
jgi:two-component system response regulator AtoC